MNRENVAKALRGAAEFCLDPASPKTHGSLAAKMSTLRSCRPNDPEATHWCGAGYVAHLLGVENLAPIKSDFGVSLEYVIFAFDDRQYETAAQHLIRAAESVEAHA